MPARIRIIIGVLLSAILLWFLFRNTDWRELNNILRQVDAGWLILALILSFGSSFTKVQRWSYVVRASYPVKFRPMFSAVQTGLLANCFIPAGIGDVVRGYVLSSLAKISFASSLTLVALDRVSDVLAMVVVLIIALLSFPKNADILFATGAFGNTEPFVVSSSIIQSVTVALVSLLVSVLLLLIFLYFKQDLILRLLTRLLGSVSPRLAAGVRTTFINLAAGMHVFRSGTQMSKSVLFSLITWGLVALSFAALFRAFHLEFPWYGPIMMLAILGVFTSIPVTPGLVGQYHVPVVACLLMLLPGIDLVAAKAVAIVAHLVALSPPVFLGIYCMLSERLGIHDLLPKRSVKLRQ